MPDARGAIPITIHSPVNLRTTLLYIGPREGGCHMGYSAESYAEAFGVTEADVGTALGPSWIDVKKENVAGWLERAEQLTKRAQERAQAPRSE